MRKAIVGLALAVAVSVPLAAAQSSQPLAKFDGGIGVIPTGSGNTAVRGVPGAGQIWVIARLTGDVDQDGDIRIDGRGLLFGAGNNVGRSGNVTVRAVFSCSAANMFTSTPVQVDINGDFRIEGALSPLATNTETSLPSECPDPVLLIVNNTSGSWFAAGIPKW